MKTRFLSDIVSNNDNLRKIDEMKGFLLFCLKNSQLTINNSQLKLKGGNLIP